MRRQKQLHDSRTAYEKFNVGDQVFVFFPVRPIGTSSKFPSYWRGPYKITGVLSDVLYKVNCGRNGLDQPIHCNRIRARTSQLLRGEIMTENIGPHSEGNLGAGQTGQTNTENVETPPIPDRNRYNRK